MIGSYRKTWTAPSQTHRTSMASCPALRRHHERGSFVRYAVPDCCHLFHGDPCRDFLEHPLEAFHCTSWEAQWYSCRRHRGPTRTWYSVACCQSCLPRRESWGNTGCAWESGGSWGACRRETALVVVQAVSMWGGHRSHCRRGSRAVLLLKGA